MTVKNPALLLCALFCLPACRSVDSACERVEELTAAEGSKISNVSCQISVRKLEGPERDAVVECLNDANDEAGFRACFN